MTILYAFKIGFEPLRTESVCFQSRAVGVLREVVLRVREESGPPVREDKPLLAYCKSEARASGLLT